MENHQPSAYSDLVILQGATCAAELARMHAPLVRIGRIARPEPVIRAFTIGQDSLGSIGHELHSPSHRRIVQGDEEKVKQPSSYKM